MKITAQYPDYVQDHPPEVLQDHMLCPECDLRFSRRKSRKALDKGTSEALANPGKLVYTVIACANCGHESYFASIKE